MEKWLIHGSSCSSDSAYRKWGSATQTAEGGEWRETEGENRHSCRQLENENAFPCRRQWRFSLNKNALISAGFLFSPKREKRCNSTTGFRVSYDLWSSHNNSTTQLGSVINFGKTPKMPYSTKLTFYPGEALIKFEIFHCRWGSQMPKPSNLHTSLALSSPQDLHTSLPPGFRYAWLPMKLKQTATFAFLCAGA